MKTGNLNGQGLAELQNYVFQNLLSAPSGSVKAGRFYFSTSNNTLYVYDGTNWKDALAQGTTYSGGNGIDITGSSISVDIATGGNAGNVTLTASSNGLAGSVAEASTSTKGIIEIATDSEASTGTSEVLAINPKQLASAVSGLIDLTDLSIASGSSSYLGYDNTTGQFSINVSTTPASAGTDLITTGGVYSNTVSAVTLKSSSTDTIQVTKAGSTSDIKISKVDEATKATQDENGDNIVSTYATKSEISNFIELTDLSIASSSSNYLSYDNTTGQFSANVDTTVGTVSTNLVTSGAVQTAIENAVAGVIIPKASIAATSDLPTLVKAHVGWMYNFSASFTTTSDFVEGAGVSYPAGTNVVVVEYTTNTYKYDVFSGFVDTSSFITASSTDTLTNKTIDADDNTIADLTVSNFKSGVIRNASDGIRAVGTATDTALCTEACIATALASKSYSVQNPALTESSGSCTWTITHNMNNSNVSVSVYEVTSGDTVMYDTSISSANAVVVTILASADIAADTYKAVVLG